MEFFDITEESTAFPGEYIFHIPSEQIVMCGSFNRKNNEIKVMGAGRLFVDKIENFKKIRLNKHEQRRRRISGCRSCKK